jgi:hypothetical protein
MLSHAEVQQYESWAQTALAQVLQLLVKALPVEQTECAQLPPLPPPPHVDPHHDFASFTQTESQRLEQQ